MMLQYVFRPAVRPVASRLAATPPGTNATVEYQQQPPSPVFAASDPTFANAQSLPSPGGWHNGSASSLPVIWPMHCVFEEGNCQITNAPSDSGLLRPRDAFEDVDRQMTSTPTGSEFGDELEPSIAAHHESAPFSQAPSMPLVYNTPQANAAACFQPVPVSVLWPVFRAFDGTLMYSLPVQPESCDASASVGDFSQDLGETCYSSTLSEYCHQQDPGEVSTSIDQPPQSLDSPLDSMKGARRQRRARRGHANRRTSALATSYPTEEPFIEDSIAGHEIDEHAFGEGVSSDATHRDMVSGDGNRTWMLPGRMMDPGGFDFAQSWQIEALDEEDNVHDIEGMTSLGAQIRADEEIDPLLNDLEDPAKKQATLDWVLNSVWPLALTKRGCRIVQKAMEIGSADEQQQVVNKLHGHAREALRSPHANHVLQRCIETMPPACMQFVLDELRGEAAYAARHRFGCRIIQRLIEHCPREQTEKLIEELLVETAKLCRHQYGNFVIQHILQHGSTDNRREIVVALCGDTIRLAKHRIASHVLSCAMVHCHPEDVRELIQIVLYDSGQLADLSRRQYGSFVVREVNRVAKLLNVAGGDSYQSPVPMLTS